MQSAEKRTRQIIKRTTRNRQVKSRLKTTTRRFQEALENKDAESATLSFSLLIKEIDKAAAKGILHKNNAARKKSKFTRLFNLFLESQTAAKTAL